jgi:putative lipoprotein
MRHTLLLAAALGALSALAACQIRVPFNTAPDRTHNTRFEQLRGTLTYRQRIALPPDAVATVRLVEIGGEQIAIARTASQGRQVPLPFTLDYDPARIVAGRRYALHAAIADSQGRPLWTEAAPFPLSFVGEPIAIRLVAAAATP